MQLLQKEKEAKLRYAEILSSSLSLMQQQSKIEWLKYGDDSTRFFHAKAKQRKMATYTFSLNDNNGGRVEGFEQVQQVLLHFFEDLLGRKQVTRRDIN